VTLRLGLVSLIPTLPRSFIIITQPRRRSPFELDKLLFRLGSNSRVNKMLNYY